MQVAKRLNFAACKPRSPTLWGLFPYDGNIIGGFLLGTGMFLTGSCPGTVFVQLATGIPSCVPIALGAVLGGVLYAGLHRRVLPSTQKASAIYDGLHSSEPAAAVTLATLCGLAVYSATQLAPTSSEGLFTPVQGGLAIAGVQAMSLVLTGGALGVSTAYEQIGHLFWWATDPRPQNEKGKRPAISSTVFSGGLFVGAWLLSRIVELPEVDEKSIGVVRAIVGGALLSFGSRVGGGCTSGHGISGMASMGVASYVTSAAMFGGGIAAGLVFR